MPHQQKLRHTAELTNVAAAGAVVITHGLQLDSDNHPAMAIAPQMVEVMYYGADPGATKRWWVTNMTATQFTFNWAGFNNLAGCNMRVHAKFLHSICQDFSAAERMY